jgi:hypothetical protein
MDEAMEVSCGDEGDEELRREESGSGEESPDTAVRRAAGGDRG